MNLRTRNERMYKCLKAACYMALFLLVGPWQSLKANDRPRVYFLVDVEKAGMPIYVDNNFAMVAVEEGGPLNSSKIPANGKFYVEFKDSKTQHKVSLRRITEEGSVDDLTCLIRGSGRKDWRTKGTVSGKHATNSRQNPPVGRNKRGGVSIDDIWVPLAILIGFIMMGMMIIIALLVRRRQYSGGELQKGHPQTGSVGLRDFRNSANQPPEAMTAQPSGGAWPQYMKKSCKHFEPVALLGRGGMGTVWSVVNKKNKQTRTVVKLLYEQYSGSDTSDAKRFYDETEVLEKLSNTGLAPKVYSKCQYKPSPGCILWYEMEDLVTAGFSPLRKLIGGGAARCLDAQAAMELAQSLVAAIHKIHSQHVVHRDLSPENIMVRKLKQGWRVKLIDFGSARAHGTIVDEKNELLGKEKYASPEQWEKGLHCADEKSDWYSLGIVIWEAFFGTVPHIDRKSHRVPKRDMAPLLRLGVPKSVAFVIVRLFHPLPDFRPMEEEIIQAFLGSRKEMIAKTQLLGTSPDPPNSGDQGLRQFAEGLEGITLIGRISSDASGEFWRASTTTSPKDRHVLRLLKINGTKTPSTIDHEIDRLKKARRTMVSPCVIRHGVSSGVAWGLLDGLGNRDLRPLAESKEIPVDAFQCELVRSICRLHEAGIVHGRLSPKSILVEMKGKIPSISLAGFGPLTDGLFGGGHGGPGVASFIAPELNGHRSTLFDPRSDWFSVGSVFMWIANGELSETKNGEPPNPRKLMMTGLAREKAIVIAQMCHHRMDLRPDDKAVAKTFLN